MKEYSKYKFAIKEILESKPANKIQFIRKEMIDRLDISRTWLSRIINARIGSTIKLDHIQLLIIADILKCKIDKLITKECRMKVIEETEKEKIAA